MSKHEKDPHPIFVQLRELRRAAGLSLDQFAAITHLPAVVVGSYERGDRQPTLARVEAILGRYGYELQAVPVGATVIPPAGSDTRYVLTGEQIVGLLRVIAGQLEDVDAKHGPGALVDPVTLAALRQRLAGQVASAGHPTAGTA